METPECSQADSGLCTQAGGSPYPESDQGQGDNLNDPFIKSSFSDYTEQEFIELLERIMGNGETEKEESRLVFHFNSICGHPERSDLIFYPAEDADDSAKGITETVKEWRAANGLPGFKQ
ncbi:bacteriocin immunity protein [Pseudomonas sp. Seg1]|uniref:bacteriocin immunity protein n=1 Tax=Pseudomonas sp. Seg1 TaxID=2678259 RepID=UPI0028EECCEA|nr:bacteriocin immunity protein [uncultured Pseudomonas sp.]